MELHFADYLSQAGAKVLADRIEQHWRRKGYSGIKCWVLPSNNRAGPDRGTFVVRSSIGPDGYPPREAWEQSNHSMQADSMAGARLDLTQFVGLLDRVMSMVEIDPLAVTTAIDARAEIAEILGNGA